MSKLDSSSGWRFRREHDSDAAAIRFDRHMRAADLSKSITSKQKEVWAAGTPLSWANETQRVAVEKVYAVVAEGGDPPKLGRDYVTTATPVVAEQIERAGVRLAVVLNDAIK